MLIPRFSLRLLLAVTTVCGLFFYVVMLASRGHNWAIGISAAVAGLLVTLCLHVGVFACAWTLTSFWQQFRKKPTTASPFASAGPPQQIMPPIDPE